MRGMKTRAVCAALGLLLGLPIVSGCAGKNKELDEASTMSAQDTYSKGLDQLSRRKLTNAVSTFQLVDLRFFDPVERRDLEPLVKLGLADATFYQGHDIALIDARSLYHDFVTLYPDHDLAPYAQFQAGICSLKQVNHPSKDQTQTYQAIQALREVERRFPTSRFVKAARDMLRMAEANLVEHEFIVGSFYAKRKAYTAAIQRFRRALNEYPDALEREKVVFNLGRALFLADQKVEGKLYLDKLLADYPGSEYAAEAKAMLSQFGGELQGELELSADGKID